MAAKSLITGLLKALKGKIYMYLHSFYKRFTTAPSIRA